MIPAPMMIGIIISHTTYFSRKTLAALLTENLGVRAISKHIGTAQSNGEPKLRLRFETADGLTMVQ